MEGHCPECDALLDSNSKWMDHLSMHVQQERGGDEDDDVVERLDWDDMGPSLIRMLVQKQKEGKVGLKRCFEMMTSLGEGESIAFVSREGVKMQVSFAGQCAYSICC